MAEHLLGLPHHDGSPLHCPDGAPAPGDAVRLRVRVPHADDGRPGARHVVLRAVRDGEPALVPAEVESTDASGSWWAVELEVHNPVTSYRFFVDGPDGGYRWLNGAGAHGRDVPDAGDFTAVAHPAPPGWLADQVAYQVFPDRFARSGAERPAPGWAEPAGWDDPVVHRGPRVQAQWYGGDLDGVAQRLDHLEQLGATLLYLTPVFEGRSNHRYDAVSFEHVDPVLGGDEALHRLVAQAHARGIRVVGDLTTNHTGVDHEWFQRAAADALAEEAGFYTFHEHPHDYASWLGVRSLPKLRHDSEALRRRLYEGDRSTVARWLRLPDGSPGLDGWRVDVANMTGRHGAEDHAHAVARAMRATMAAVRDDLWLLAEHGHDATADLGGDGWHGTMDYAGFTRPVWAWLNGGGEAGPGHPHGLQFLGLPTPVPVLDGHAVVATMRDFHAAMGWRAWTSSTSQLDSHDTPRFRTVAGGGTSGWVDASGAGRARHLVGLALQMALPGVPQVFAGDEIGLTAVDGEHARTPFPWHRRDEWDAPTWQAYRRWVGLRRAHVALRRGGLRWAHVGADSLTFLREHPEERVLVHVARADHEQVALPLRHLGLGAAREVDPLDGAAEVGEGAGTLLLPREGPGAHAYRLPPER